MSKAIILQHRNAARSKVVPAAADPRQFLLFDGAPYVFDGNCVVAHSDGGENGQGTWWLETVMPPYIWVFRDGAIITVHLESFLCQNPSR